MAWLFQQRTFGPSKLTAESVQQFINTHTEYLNQALDTAIKEKSLDDISIQRLKESNYVFSGIKTFHELNEAFPKLIDEDGNKIPFNQFLNNVQSINESYNRTYLKTEYEFAQSSAMMAARWKEFEKDGDNYYLQYRTVGDKRVRKTHRMLHNITLPFSSKFWDKYFPPNGWNCRCTVVQVRKDKYKMSDEATAMNAGSQATAGKHQEMFMFNPGKEMTTFPAYNAYTIKNCKTCPYRLGKMELIKDETSSNELCLVCKFMRGIHKDPNDNNYDIIPTSKGKVRIHTGHGKAEREENLAIATYLANKYGYEIDLLDNPQNIKTADSYNKTLGIEQEYKRAQTPTKNAIDRLIRDGKKQANNLVLLLDFKMNLSWDDMTKVLRPRVVRSENIESITFIYEGKDVTLSREEILKEGFKIRLADLK